MLLFASAVVLLLLVLNGLFAMSELAVVSSRRAKLQSRADRGDKGAAVALKLSENPTRFLAAVQVGITLIGILAGAFGQATIAAELDAMLEQVPALQQYSEGLATGIVVVVLTYFSLVVGELVPKRFALAFPETIAALVSRPLMVMARVLSPFVTLLTFSTAGVLKVIGVKDQQGEEITHEEVETVLAEGTSAGLIEPAEQAMIGEVMRLGDRPVRVAMTPRRDVHWISLSDPLEQQTADIRACPYSRMVVARGSDVDEPVGVVHKKDVLDAMLDGQRLDLPALMVTPVFISETTSVLKAFELLKQSPLHMALVVDEFGAMEGVVTATDLLEMIAGDFDEAHDQDTPSAILQREDGSFLIDGRADIEDVARHLKADFDETGHFHTAAGLVLHEAGRLPEEGEVFNIAGYEVEVVDMDDRRIDKLLFRRRSASERSQPRAE
ncbi:hemolysin family protein [Phenylobacterium sp. SCN 70-31]|uniref:hemolysin family protein n=1 Tax=Phenylobacterium sp. SCN 70-31 TaxID=1660129 RepID=UPI000AC87205|nr:hemolysin family protein [Phenylobacterium sp. SCN 70-31]